MVGFNEDHSRFYLSEECYIDFVSQVVVDKQEGKTLNKTDPITAGHWRMLLLLIQNSPRPVDQEEISSSIHIAYDSVRKYFSTLKSKHSVLGQWLPACVDGKYKFINPDHAQLKKQDICTTQRTISSDTQYETIDQAYVKKADPSMPTAIDYVPIQNTACELRSTRIIHNDKVYVLDDKRRKVYTDIDNAFSQGHNAVLLRGFGGTGKSTFAKRYALDKLADGIYATVVFAPLDVKKGNVNLQTLICDDVIFSITNFPKRREIVSTDNQGQLIQHSEKIEDFFSRKLAKLKEISSYRKTLIIIDNFDVTYDSEIMRFLDGDYHVIITTRYSFPDIPCKQIELETLDPDALKELFFNYSGRTDISPDAPELTEMIQLLGCHTMAIEIIARYMAAEETASISDVVKKLREKGSLRNIDGAIQISSEFEEKLPFEYISALFDVTSLINDKKYAEVYETILAGMSLMPLSGVKKDDFLRWCGINSTIAVNKLIQRSWVAEDERDGERWISMHPLVAEVMRDRFKPDFTNCDKLTASLVTIAKNSYHLKIETVAYISTIIKRMINLCVTCRISEYKILVSFAEFFSTVGEIEEAKSILDNLLHTATTTDQVHPIVLANIYSQLAIYYLNARMCREAVSNREKAISFFEQCEDEQDMINELKLLIIWDYIQGNDIISASAYIGSIKSWIENECPGTKQYARYLHVLARLDYENGNYRSAIKLESEALPIFEAISDDSFDCGSIYYVLGLSNAKYPDTFDLGIEQLKKCLEIWSRYRTPQHSKIIDAHKYIADAYFDSGRFTEALIWYNRCMGLMNAIENSTLSHGLLSVRTTVSQRIKECNSQITN